jgi:hypothetical protein
MGLSGGVDDVGNVSLVFQTDEPDMDCRTWFSMASCTISVILSFTDTAMTDCSLLRLS